MCSIEHMYGSVISEKLTVHVNFVYYPHSNGSILNRTMMQASFLCAGQCIRSSTCETATFDHISRACILFTESARTGQLIQNNQTVTFERQGEFLLDRKYH